MKKKILSIALALCMVLTMMPMATGVAWAAAPIENVTFGYAYDAQRDPDFPSESGKIINLRGLDRPLNGETTGDRVGNADEWTLIKVGTYSFVKSENLSVFKPGYLESIVSTIANEYKLDKEAIVIHKLQNSSGTIAYGVVIAYDATNGYAFFIGDHWGLGGAGYLLSKDVISNSSSYTYSNPFKITASEIATDFVQQLSIALDHTDTHTFTSQTTETVKKEKPGWKTTKSKKKYYVKSDGYRVVGSYKIKNIYYVFDQNGYLLESKKA